MIILISISGCKKEDVTERKSSGLEGTRSIVPINGKAPASGYFSILEFTSGKVTITSDIDCKEVDSYSVSGNKLNTTVIQVTGTQCGNKVGQQFSGDFKLEGDQLTLINVSTRVYIRIK